MRSTAEVELVPVVIVGAGPVGLLLGALLSTYGIPSVVLEQGTTYCEGSRAICISRRSLEILAWAGIDRKVTDKGLGWSSGRSYFRSREVLSFSMLSDPGGRFPAMTNLQQYYLEEFIHHAIQRDRLCEVRWGAQVTTFDEDSEAVLVRYLREGEERQIRAHWLIAADGASSTIRNQLKLPLLGTSYEGQHIIVDIEQQSSQVVERMVWFDPPSNPGATVIMHRQPDQSWRLDFQVAPGDDLACLMQPEHLQARIQSHLDLVGETQPWKLKWVSTHQAKCYTLESYRRARVILMGDAAHLMPVFGVRGLNSGLDDVGNLAWKLAWVVHGQAPVSLLDTYSLERVQAARLNLERSARTTEFMSPPTFAHAVMQEATLRLAVNEPRVRSLINLRQPRPAVYEGSILNQPDGVPQDGPLAAPGVLAPEIELIPNDPREGQQSHFLSQAFGRGFVLLTFEACEHIAARMQTLVAQANEHAGLPGVSWLDIGARPGRSPWYADAALLQQGYGAIRQRVYLLRPDGYILGRWPFEEHVALVRALQPYYAALSGLELHSAPAGV